MVPIKHNEPHKTAKTTAVSVILIITHTHTHTQQPSRGSVFQVYQYDKSDAVITL